MSSVTSIPPLRLIDPSDDPEHYEFLNGSWEKKQSVGREEHSRMDQVLYRLLNPIARQLGCKLRQEWTIVQGERKLVPDVTLSYPAPFYRVTAGYLAAPALLAVESRSQGQRLQVLVDKCLNDHHAMGTQYCWIIDIEQQNAYERNLAHRVAKPVSILTFEISEIHFELSVARLFQEFKNEE